MIIKVEPGIQLLNAQQSLYFIAFCALRTLFDIYKKIFHLITYYFDLLSLK
jgi:hypothetical protein